jgi:undecaprenyl-diphosphatase
MPLQALDERGVAVANEFVGRFSILSSLTVWVGVYTVYVVPIFLVALWFRGLKELALRAFFAGVFGWLVVSNIIGGLYFRPRPELAALGGQELLFHRPTYSFPSDHATLFTALAVTFYLFGYKKLGFWTGLVGLLVSIARVALGFHYPTDILGGIVVGGLTAWVLWLLRKYADRFLVQPLLDLARFLHL